MGAVTEQDASPVPTQVSIDTEHSYLAKWRYRVLFSKLGPLRYISHLDLARLWERIFRRAQLPLAYSQGFNPRPKIQLAAGLPLGYLSQFEIVDFWVLDPINSFPELIRTLEQASPEGIEVSNACGVALSEPALQSITDSATYTIRFLDSVPDDLSERLQAFRDQPSCIRTRRDKQYDLRTLVDKLEQVEGQAALVKMTLALSQQRGTARPDEVIDALELGSFDYEITRTHIEVLPPYNLGVQAHIE